VHFDEKDEPVRIEILDAKRFLQKAGFVLPNKVKEKFFSLV
jgi:hypothetical protein